ncbi:MAG TPA: chromosome segregation protein SMC [Nitrospiraceae bacterium]|nr:chromosome segregation protein SMC [Nitrospiraceae bacterium]
MRKMKGIMKIKQIELIGFKSFADKSLFPLHNGITCIVGPNGCGKSNVVDAFRWVLGEQSAKSLRGEKMEEVIFQGSAAKKQKGMAEVTLVVSQSGKPSAGNGSGNGSESGEDVSDEMTVSRRLYRSGESEYLMNKRQCRLRDIKDVFLDTGLDVKSYSILDQGRIGEIINTKPHERRFLIEEIAGVMKYKVRRAEALSKLESSKQNLQRINDIVYEVKRQINSLDRQVKKAERYKRLIEELKAIELRIAKKEYTSLSGALTILLSEIEKLREADSAKRGELSTLENFIETKRIEIAEKEKALAALESALNEKERSIADSEKRIAVLKANMENKRLDIDRLTNLQEEIAVKKAELSGKISELDDAENALLSSMESMSIELDEKKERASEIEAAIGEKESAIEDRRKELFKASEDLSNKKNNLAKLQSASENLIYRESVAVKDGETVKGNIDELQTAAREEEEALKNKTEAISRLQAEKEAISSEIARLTEGIEDKKTLLAREREDLASNTSRLDSLKELIIDKSLADFLMEGQQTTVLSDIIAADKDFEAAIEAILSDRINSLIFDNLDDVMSVIKIIKEKQIGRTSILYKGLDVMRPASGGGNINNRITHDAVIGPASDFITSENGDAKKAAHASLENTYIVKDIRSAFEVFNSGLPAQNSELILVTLDGEVVNSRGWIFAGHGKDILKKKREIKELQRAIDERQLKIKNFEDNLNSLTDALAAKKESLKTAEDAVVAVEKEISLYAHSLQNRRDELERNARKLSFLDTELSAISQEMESTKDMLRTKTEEIGTAENARTAIDDEIASMQQSLSSKREEYEEARSQLTDMKLSLASSREKTDALRKERDNINDAFKELEDRKKEAVQEIRDSEEKIKESGSELHGLEEGIKIIIVEADGINTEKTGLKEAISSEHLELTAKDASLKGIRTEIDSVSQQLSEANTKAVENRLKIENIEGSISQKYGLEIKTEPVEFEGFDPEEDANRMNELNTKIRELGPVNLGTIEEYEELKTRYDFLTKQQQDLTMSIAELEEAISRINSTTRRKLREAYDALRTKFSEVFTVLFGGGKADIILTDEENILDAGLEIIAQPPGKKFQNINLLSGGEKALTSLSLLFAGFLIKPSPLCILDEADAPLDESNTVRFAQMIKDLSKETQFIVITHNRTTMEVADYLYGITMEEPGASKTISLQFAEVGDIG